ncbi:DUF3883 domain-containing protein [Campylobacter concisus]|uniref:DUF3883 domain-containing protein n=1 Tax=Campylobacter concisus TaxID=199 RepID=UPI000CD89658|nr:DUF3883 domain-containing protein [Campylobacter concisus]
MATSESDIRKGVSILLNRYGSLNTTEVKKLLETVILFDSDDNEMSKTRNEPLIIQRIGNIVSHQKEKQKIYYDTYIIDKKFKPAKWSILTGLKSKKTLSVITNKEIKRRKEIGKKFNPKKIDWQELNGRRTRFGLLGEEFVIRYETKRILGFAPQDTDRIIHLSEEQGDGAGFDIISLNINGTERYIEVKTTSGGLTTPFYMTENERNYFDIHKNEENLFIYRVYNFDEKKCTGNIEIIPALKLFTDYNFDPVTYKVTMK